MKSIVDDLLQRAKEAHDLLTEIKNIAPIGLGESAADITACGYIHASAHEIRDPSGQLDTSASFDTNGLARWHAGGLPRIRLSHGLASKLALTDPTGIEADEIRMPFPCYLLELPFPVGPVVLEDGTQDAAAILVMDYRLSTSRTRPKPECHSLAELLADLVRVRDSTMWDRRMIHGIVYSDTAQIRVAMPMVSSVEFRPAESGLVARDRRAGLLSSRIIINLALYIKHIDTTVSSETASGGRTVNNDHGLGSILYEVGNEVKLERTLRDAARAFCMSGAAHKKWKLDKRFIVRGHWKRQACGAERSERRLVFVAPYWKGPADAPVLARVYTGGE